MLYRILYFGTTFNLLNLDSHVVYTLYSNGTAKAHIPLQFYSILKYANFALRDPGAHCLGYRLQDCCATVPVFV